VLIESAYPLRTCRPWFLGDQRCQPIGGCQGSESGVRRSRNRGSTCTSITVLRSGLSGSWPGLLGPLWHVGDRLGVDSTACILLVSRPGELVLGRFIGALEWEELHAGNRWFFVFATLSVGAFPSNFPEQWPAAVRCHSRN
jgi:hypothetical protein